MIENQRKRLREPLSNALIFITCFAQINGTCDYMKFCNIPYYEKLASSSASSSIYLSPLSLPSD